MKLPSLLLASFALAAHAENYPAVLFCQATVVYDSSAILSVEIPSTPGYTDEMGNPVAVWRIGTVVAGGAIDSFYSGDGPGAFQVRNTGNRNAYIYITSGGRTAMSNSRSSDDYMDYYWLDGQGYNSGFLCLPDPFLRQYNEGYSLAVSTDVTARVPAWRVLSRFTGTSYQWDDGQMDSQYVGTEWHEYPSDYWAISNPICGQYLCYLGAGEVQPFDLKFYAPNIDTNDNIGFIVRLEASTFRRWDHDM